jgi:hypothetical protein
MIYDLTPPSDLHFYHGEGEGVGEEHAIFQWNRNPLYFYVESARDERSL